MSKACSYTATLKALFWYSSFWGDGHMNKENRSGIDPTKTA